jgi:hypothetical protein
LFKRRLTKRHEPRIGGAVIDKSVEMVGFWNRNARAKAGEVEKGLHVDGTR